MRHHHRLVIVLSALTVALAACGPGPQSPSPSGSPAPPSAPPLESGPPSASPDASDPGEAGGIGNLAGTGWRALQVGGVVPEAGSEPTVAFLGAEIGGSTGCNEYGAAVTTDGGRIEVGELTTTLILCEGPVGTMETAFVKALTEAEELVAQGANLLIRGPGGEILLRPDASVGS